MKTTGLSHICGGALVRKRVEKLVHGGDHTAVVEVDAEVCEHCGERLYSVETVRRMEDIRAKLAMRDTSEFVPIGQTFQVKQEGPTAG